MDEECQIDYQDGGFEDVQGHDPSASKHQKIRRQFYAKKRKAAAAARSNTKQSALDATSG